MPIASIATARDEILVLFKAAWDAGPAPVPPLIYTDRPEDVPDSGAWARVMVQHNLSSQATLGGKTSLGGGGQRFRRVGLVTVQIFTPSGGGLTQADSLVDLAVDAFEGESTGSDRVEFRDVRAVEAGHDGPWHQFNVFAEFMYDRVK